MKRLSEVPFSLSVHCAPLFPETVLKQQNFAVASFHRDGLVFREPEQNQREQLIVKMSGRPAATKL